VLVTSHALEEAEAVSSRLFILANGKLKFHGTSTELRNQFKCGYLLRIEREDGTVGGVLDLAKRYVADAAITPERRDTIRMPVDDRIPEFLRAMAEQTDDLGILSYSFSVEQIEDLLLKLIMEEAAEERGRRRSR
jgi:ABC-type multidrug transport system ATPase subunit